MFDRYRHTYITHFAFIIWHHVVAHHKINDAESTATLTYSRHIINYHFTVIYRIVLISFFVF